MMGITSADQIVKLEPQKSIVGVFLATGYDRDAIEWLQSAWSDIHMASGEYWYLLVPVRAESLPGMPREIDIELSAEIRGMYGIDERQTPCIVFDNFDESVHQRTVTLIGTDDSRKKTMLAVAKILRESAEKLGDAGRTDRWRRQVIDELHDRIRAHEVGAFIIGRAPKAFSLLPKVLRYFGVIS
jgi:hypothetical protein